MSYYRLPHGGNCASLELMSEDAKYKAVGERYTGNFKGEGGRGRVQCGGK